MTVAKKPAGDELPVASHVETFVSTRTGDVIQIGCDCWRGADHGYLREHHADAWTTLESIGSAALEVSALEPRSLRRASLLVATSLGAHLGDELWEFCLHSSREDSPLSRDIRVFTGVVTDDAIRAYALRLYALCPFTVEFKSIIPELGYATAMLRPSRQLGLPKRH